MDWFEAFILGVIQGLTEFLPISSTGHLYIGRNLFGLKEAGLFLDTMLHLGTLIALLVYYKDILFDLVKKPFTKLSLLLIAGTIPSVFAGLLFKDFFDNLSTTGITIGWEFLVTGTFLWFADSIKKGQKQLKDINFNDALFIGCFQALAIFPAVSRSGLTITAGLFRKLNKEVAAYFSFLLSIPAVLGAVMLQLGELFEASGHHHDVSLSALLIATLASAIFGYVAIAWMINYVKNHPLKHFAIYVWALGLVILSLQFIGVW